MMNQSRPAGHYWARRRAGLTLIELLVTATLLGIGLSAVSIMFIYAYQAQVHSHYVTAATDVARRYIEEMKAAGYNGINETLFPPTFEVPELPGGIGTISYEPYPTEASTSQYKAEVTVTWDGARGIAGSVTLTTVIALRP